MRIEWHRYHVRLTAIGRIRWDRGAPTSPIWRSHRALVDNDLWFVWAGAGRARLRTGSVELRPGVCLWMRPGRNYPITQDPRDPLGMNFLHFDLLDEHDKLRPAAAPLPPERIEPPDPQLAEVTTRRLVELGVGFQEPNLWRPPRGEETTRVAAALLTGLLMELDAATDTSRPRQTPAVTPYYDRLIRQVAVRITESPQDTPPVAQLAAEFGYSPDHFARIFKTVTGQTPELYAVQARLQRAQRLLRETTLSVGEVAARLGYCNIYFFSRQFKQFTLRTPLQYRNQSAPVLTGLGFYINPAISMKRQPFPAPASTP